MSENVNEFVDRIAQATKNYCADHKITHPDDVGAMLAILAEAMASVEEWKDRPEKSASMYDAHVPWPPHIPTPPLTDIGVAYPQVNKRYPTAPDALWAAYKARWDAERLDYGEAAS